MPGNPLKDVLKRAKGHFVRYRWVYLLLTAVFIVGLVVGLGMPERLDTENSGELSLFLSNMLKQLPSAEIDSGLEMSRALYLNGIVLLLIWFLGFTIIGSPLVAAILLYKGLCLGMAVSFLLDIDRTQGIIMTLMAIIPQNLLLIPTFIIASQLAVGFSLGLLKNGYRGRQDIVGGFVHYSCYFAVLLIVVLFSAYIQGYFDPWLLRMLFKIT